MVYNARLNNNYGKLLALASARARSDATAAVVARTTAAAGAHVHPQEKLPPYSDEVKVKPDEYAGENTSLKSTKISTGLSRPQFSSHSDKLGETTWWVE